MNRHTAAHARALELALIVSVFAVPVVAQQHDSTQAGARPTMDQSGPPKDFFKNMMGDMAQSMGNMAEVMIDAQLKALSRPETAEQLATFTRNYYEALVKKGFTKSEALQVITSVQALPTPGSK